MAPAVWSAVFADRWRQKPRSKLPRPERPRGYASYSLLFSGEVGQHQLPVDDIVVQRLHGKPLILAVGAIVGRHLDPGAVRPVNRDSDDPEGPGIARSGRHFGED